MSTASLSVPRGIEEHRRVNSSGNVTSVVHRQDSVHDKYEIMHLIGSGITGEVKLCKERQSEKFYACKIVKTVGVEQHKLQQFYDEINILGGLSHPNVICLKDVYVTDEQLFIVTELCTGGELFDRILDSGSFTEKDARNIIKTLFRAVAYMHSHNIVHRDLKPENILFADETKDAAIKIADFGFAKKLRSRTRMRMDSQVGTLGYAAPEVFSGKGYSENTDVWSLGVISYILLAGVPPFCELPNDEDSGPIQTTPFWIYINKMKAVSTDVQVEFPPKYWKGISQQAQDFVKFVLNPNPVDRPTADNAAGHPWLQTPPSSPQNQPVQHGKPLHKTLRNMRWFTMTLRRGTAEPWSKRVRAQMGASTSRYGSSVDAGPGSAENLSLLSENLDLLPATPDNEACVERLEGLDLASRKTPRQLLREADSFPNDLDLGRTALSTSDRVAKKVRQLSKHSSASSSMLPSSKEIANVMGKHQSPNTCSICQKHIEGPTAFQVKGVKYHEACLKCSMCSKQFSKSDNIYVKKGKFLCRDDFVKNCSTCSQCNKTIELGRVIRVRRKEKQYQYHEKCFVCKRCGRGFAKHQKYYLSRGAVICANCRASRATS